VVQKVIVAARQHGAGNGCNGDDVSRIDPSSFSFSSFPFLFFSLFSPSCGRSVSLFFFFFDEDPAHFRNSENRMNYEGDRLNGQRHGKGKQVFEDGSQFEGDWVDNKKHGHGTYKYASGACYTGQ